MSAWTKLLSASSLAIGTAWDLISSPRTGGVGTTVYVEQIQSSVSDAQATSVLQDGTIQTGISDGTIRSTISVTDAVTALPDNTITVETT